MTHNEQALNRENPDATSFHSLVRPEMIPSLAGKRVLIVGDLMLDAYLVGDAERISPEAPVPVVRVEEENFFLGGAGNVARNVADLGGKATLVGCIGTDRAGSRLRELMQAGQILSGLVEFGARPTTVKTRVLARSQQMLRLDREDTRVFTGEELEHVLAAVRQHLCGHDVVILSDYNKGLVSAPFMEGFRRLLDACSCRPKVLVDPKPAHMDLYGGTLLMTPNAKETGEGVGLPVGNTADVLAAGRALLARSGCPYLLTTLGAGGMALFIGEHEVWHVPTMAQSVFDVTGAGDTVIATLGLALAAGHSLLPACVLANYAAGLVVARVGAATASPEALADAVRTLPAPVLSRWD